MNFYARALWDDLAMNARILSRWFASWWYHPTIDATQAAMVRHTMAHAKSMRGTFCTMRGMQREADRINRMWHSGVTMEGLTLIDVINKALGPGEYMYSDRFGKLHVAELKVSGERPHEFLFTPEDYK